jgi:hypothetical protein
MPAACGVTPSDGQSISELLWARLYDRLQPLLKCSARALGYVQYHGTCNPTHRKTCWPRRLPPPPTTHEVCTLVSQNQREAMGLPGASVRKRAVFCCLLVLLRANRRQCEGPSMLHQRPVRVYDAGVCAYNELCPAEPAALGLCCCGACVAGIGCVASRDRVLMHRAIQRLVSEGVGF